MHISFEKWHGCENDFILIWTSPTQRRNIQDSILRQSSKICSRRTGIGADGILLIEEGQQAPTPEQVLIINSDGSLAKTCGNGLRCVALSSYRKFLEKRATKIDSLELKTSDHHYLCQFIEQGSRLPLVQMDMGIPLLDEANLWHKETVSFVEETFQKLSLSKFQPEIHTANIANRHLILCFEEHSPELSQMRELGKALQHPSFGDGINVSFIKNYHGKTNALSRGMLTLEKSEPYDVFIWERGAGETPACGSAAASIAACILNSELTPRSSWIPLKFPGGWLLAKQESKNESVILCSNADFVFEGALEI